MSMMIEGMSRVGLVLVGLILSITADFARGQGISLGGGTVTRNNVKVYADLSLDVVDIRRSSDIDAASRIFRQGTHATLPGGFSLSLASLEGGLRGANFRTPVYAFHLYGLADRSADSQDLATHQSFMNTITEFHLNAGSFDLAADSIIALHLWMYATHILYSGAMLCEGRTTADNPERVEIGFSLAGGGMDEFIALWIGTNQVPGSINGPSLYAWTERIGRLFGTATSEARVNTQLKILYEEGAVALNLPRACTKENDRTTFLIWNVINQIVRQMYIPLYQWLIFSLLKKDVPASQMYAKALVPQLSQCRPTQYTRLKAILMDSLSIDETARQEALTLVYASLECFQLTCSDIGMWSEEQQYQQCSSGGLFPKLAGLTTTSNVAALAQVDLDAYQLEILTALGDFRFAELLYRHGKNSIKPRNSQFDPFLLLSLQEISNRSRQRSTSLTKNFLRYHQEKRTEYGDTAIMNTLNGLGKWGERPNRQRAVLVKLAAVYHIVYVECIGLFEEAFSVCESSDSDKGFDSDINPLDQALALYIGYMEGEHWKGSPVDGQFVYGLANEMAYQFQVTNNDGIAVINDEIEDLFYAAKGQLDALDCVRVARSVERIERLLLVSLLQRILLSATQSKTLTQSSSHPSIVEGEVFALAALPSINSVQESSAEIIHRNLIIQANKEPVGDGITEIGNTVGLIVTKGLNLPCRYVGGNDHVEPCRTFGGRSSGDSRHVTFLIMALSTLVGILIL